MKPIPNLTAHTLLMLAVALGTTSCSRESAEEASAPATAPAVRSLQEGVLPEPVPEGSSHPELPASGEIVIHPSGEGVTVLANQASATRLVRRLSRSFDFDLELLEFQDRPVGVYAVDGTLGDVLEQALEGIPYAVRYGVRSGRSRLVWLAVGERSGRTVAELKREREEPAEERRKEDEREGDEAKGEREERERGAQEAEERQERTRPLRPDDAERRDRFLAGRAYRETARRTENLEALESSDPETRQEAVQMLDPETGDVHSLAQIAVRDQDYRVRIAAVEQLELSGSRTAVEAITGALWDPEAEVVVAAVKALRLLGDSNTIPIVEPLLAHENREVRDRARELVELLQDREPSE